MATVTFLSAGMPAVAAAMAGLRFQGDFQRFSERSGRTAKELARIDKALENFIAAARTPTDMTSRNLFDRLRQILRNLENVLLSDLQDWQFVYRARPSPDV